jgi:hypothetical protein
VWGVGYRVWGAAREPGWERRRRLSGRVRGEMMKFLLWCVLLVLCWPLAIFALVLYPIVWLILLPFRLVGIAVEGVLELVWALITLPARLLREV